MYRKRFPPEYDDHLESILVGPSPATCIKCSHDACAFLALEITYLTIRFLFEVFLYFQIIQYPVFPSK